MVVSSRRLASRRLAGFVVSDDPGSTDLSFKAHDPIWDRDIREPVRVDGRDARRALLDAGATPAVASFDREGRVRDLELAAH